MGGAGAPRRYLAHLIAQRLGHAHAGRGLWHGPLGEELAGERHRLHEGVARRTQMGRRVAELLIGHVKRVGEGGQLRRGGLERLGPLLHVCHVGLSVSLQRVTERRHRGAHLLPANDEHVARGVVIAHGAADRAASVRTTRRRAIGARRTGPV